MTRSETARPAGRLGVRSLVPSALVPLALGALAAGLTGCTGRSATPVPGDGLEPGTGPGTDPGGILLVDFELRTDLVLGELPVVDAKVLDLDGDGFYDLAELGFTDQRLRLSLGSPGGQWLAWQEFETPGVPLRLESADLSGTGGLDLVVLYAAGPSGGNGGGDVSLTALAENGAVAGLAVYRRGGDGLFELAMDVALPAFSMDMAVGPLLGNGRDQVVVAGMGDGTLWVHDEVAPWALVPVAAPTVPGPAGTSTPVSVALADVDGDGLLDLVAGLVAIQPGEPGAVAVLRQLPGGGFGEPEHPLEGPAFPVVRALGDVTESGFADVGVGDAAPGAALFHLLAGSSAGLDLSQAFPVGAPSSVSMGADVNGDGRLDLVLGAFTDQAVVVHLADGAGGFAEGRVHNVGFGPRALAGIDFAGDGREDVVVVHSRGTSLLIALEDGRLRAAEGFFVGDAPHVLSLVDLDGDGLLDAVSVDLHQREVVFLRGLPGRRFEYVGAVELMESTEGLPAFFEVADLSGNGFSDVLVSVSEAAEVRLLRGHGTLPLAAPESFDRVSVGPQPLGITVGDLDGDGQLDAVVACFGDGTLRVLRGQGGGDLNDQTVLPLGLGGDLRPVSVKLADLNGNGRLDLVVTARTPNFSASAAAVFAGDGEGGFTLEAQWPLPTVSNAIHVGEVVENGLPDLVFGQTDAAGSELVLAVNLGGFSFQSQPVPVGAHPGGVQLVDLDGDGHLDLVLALGAGELVTLAGDGTGTFTPFPKLFGLPLAAPQFTSFIRLADLDGDGLPELVLLSPELRHLWVARNTSVVISE